MNRLEAVIFDWAGTTLDFGSLAPVRAVTRLFANRSIPLSDADVRRDMGLFKKDHIRRILERPHVSAAWHNRHSRAPVDSDVDAMFREFAPLQLEILEEHAQLIAGVTGLAGRLRQRGLKLGTTTGYTRPMLDVLLTQAAEQGYRPDLALCPDDAGGGRPYPWMCLRIALSFQLSSTAAAVKVGDTPSDIEEGLNAGMWSVGVAETGNQIGLSASDLAALPIDDRRRRLEGARESLRAAGAHYVVDSAPELDPVIEQIEGRLAAGERP